MKDYKKEHPVLTGYNSKGKKELHSIEEVADFICAEPAKDVIIYDSEGKFFLNTYGLYINRIVDMEYREQLLEVLVPMQLAIEASM